LRDERASARPDFPGRAYWWRTAIAVSFVVPALTDTEEVLVLWIIVTVVLIVLLVGAFASGGRFYGRP
jgi:hypothetical protein